MAARADFPYLHSRALDQQTGENLRRIAEDRSRILSGARLNIGEEELTLRLRLPLIPGDSSAERDVALTLRRDLAPASVDTIVEIFRDEAHAAISGFRGEEPGTIVDLGANEGFYTLRMKLLSPESRIVAVEPLREHVELLKKNLESNGLTGVETEEAAVTSIRAGSVGPQAHTDATGRDTLTLETYPHVGTIASADLAAFPRPWIDPDRISRRIVPATTLGRLVRSYAIEPPAVLKLDVEGSEAAILTDDRRALDPFDRVVVEVHGEGSRERVTELLMGEGFHLIHAEEKRSGDLFWRR